MRQTTALLMRGRSCHRQKSALLAPASWDRLQCYDGANIDPKAKDTADVLCSTAHCALWCRRYGWRTQ